MNNSNLSEAFDLLLEQFSQELDALTDDMARHYRARNKPEADRLRKELDRMMSLEEKTKALRKELNPPKKEKPKSATRQPIKRAAATRMRVEFEGGPVIEEKIAADTFAKAVEELGPERVKSLDTPRAIVFSEPPNAMDYLLGSLRKVGEFFVNTNLNNSDKKRVLENIAKQLGRKLKVTIIE